MIQPPDLRLIKLHLAPGLGVVLGPLLDELHDRVAIIQRELGELLLRIGCRADGVVDLIEDAVLSGGRADTMRMRFSLFAEPFIRGSIFARANLRLCTISA